MDRISLVPNRFKSAISNQEDNFINLALTTSTKPLIEYDSLVVLNQQDIFEKERNEVKKYRFSGKINLFTANELTPTEKVVDQNGTTTITNGAINEDWDPLFDGNPQVTPNNWLIQLLYPYKKDYDFNIIYNPKNTSESVINTKAELGPQIKSLTLTKLNTNDEKVLVNCVQKHNLKIDDYVYVYNTSVTNNPYKGIHRVESLGENGFDLETKFVLDLPYTGDYTINSNYIKIYGATQSDINFDDFIEINKITSSDSNGGTIGNFSPGDTIYSRIETQTPHKLFILSGSTKYPYIDLRGQGILNGIFEVVSVTNEYVFTIKLTYFPNKGQSQNFVNPKPSFRFLEGTPSQYYVRKYKVLTTNTYDVYKCAFSTNIYPKTIKNSLGISNDTWLYHFNSDIDIGGLVDHNNKPLTELYLGLIKRSGANTFPWSNVVCGWDFNSTTITTVNGLETISKYQPNGVGTIEKPNNLYDYIGDYVEYNSLEIVEKVISKIVHRFSTMSQQNDEGYYLDPFKKMQIMYFSNIIENSSINEPSEGIPNYAETYPNGQISWRNLLPIGYIEPSLNNTNNGVDYPFINGFHYFYSNNNFYIRRQKPQQALNSIVTQDDIKIGEIQDVC